MSEKRARYVGGSESGVDVVIPLDNGETRSIHVPKGGDLPTEVDGQPIPASFRNSLLEQKDNWTEYKRPTGDDAKPATKEGDR